MARKAAFHLPKRKCRKVVSKRRVAKGSQRWIKRGKTYLLIGCPVGKWNARAQECKVGTFAIEKVKAKRGSSCPR